MLTDSTTLKQWLTFYKNTWTKYLAARLIDVQSDTTLKAINPEEEVDHEIDGMPVKIPVKKRLELRKIFVQDAVDLLASIDAFLALSEEEITAKSSKEALKVADDMLPKPAPKAGDACVDTNGNASTLVDDGNGGTVCTLVETKNYKVLKDFGDVKAGETLTLPQAGWTAEQVAERVTDGTLEVIVDQATGGSEAA